MLTNFIVICYYCFTNVNQFFLLLLFFNALHCWPILLLSCITLKVIKEKPIMLVAQCKKMNLKKYFFCVCMFYLNQILISINFEPHLLEINPPSKFPPTRNQNHTCPSQYFLPQSTSSPSGFFCGSRFFKSNTYAGGPLRKPPRAGCSYQEPVLTRAAVPAVCPLWKSVLSTKVWSCSSVAGLSGASRPPRPPVGARRYRELHQSS